MDINLKHKQFRASCGMIATVVAWDDTDNMWICRYLIGEMFYACESYIKENLI